MTMSEHVLEGCAPVPLAGYLKALGIFRIIAEQADEEVRAFWRDERFVLKTSLSERRIVDFFLNDFKPTSILSPWNAGSGFHHREGKSKEKDPSTGKRVKSGVRDEQTTATRTLEDLLRSKTERLAAFRLSALVAKELLIARNLDASQLDAVKIELIRELRSVMPEECLHWIDAATAVTQFDIAFPPLLGSGGNDGNLDFSTTFLQVILSLIDINSGEPSPASEELLISSLFAKSSRVTASMAISQFAPSAAGGPNSGVGFGGSVAGNGWDIILGIEGTLVLSAAIVRRTEAREGEASFPFMIPRRGLFSAGAGHIGPSDEKTARGEFWAPLWTRPTEFHDLLTTFREGRVVVEKRSVGNSLDFARALGQLGADRGLGYFERFAFEQRNGNMFLGVSLQRHNVKRNPNADLIAELNKAGWLERARGATHHANAPASLLALGRQLDDALFRLAEDRSADAAQQALIAIGALMLAARIHPELRKSLPPLRQLSSAWVVACKGGSEESHEFALAAALASLDAETDKKEFRFPFRRHLGPLAWPKGREGWDNTTESNVLLVWSGRDLIRDMSAVLERRLVEAQRRVFVRNRQSELPLNSQRTTQLASVAFFLAGRTDDARIAALAAGLAWVQCPPPDTERISADQALPLAYAALKPLLEPFGVGPDEKRSRIDPLPLLRLLQANRSEEAVLRGQRLARGAGLPAPFAGVGPMPVRDARRLAAALLFPIPARDFEKLRDLAYPDLKNVMEDSDAA